MINVLLIGDIVGSPGRAILKQALPKILRKRAIDYCIANAENLGIFVAATDFENA